MIAIEVNHPNLAGKSPIFCPEHATSTSLELTVVGYVNHSSFYTQMAGRNSWCDHTLEWSLEPCSPTSKYATCTQSLPWAKS